MREKARAGGLRAEGDVLKISHFVKDYEEILARRFGDGGGLRISFLKSMDSG